ncbi:UDP-N-acetylglucosamine--N-acetylmuramyl-(pentapeptide) pyrophosphoryl-undecaprenol N-acetylglucosamine transferase, partial [candidate division KSB1 bacterium]|nr:UDP-N-acetylglucosamine--N-acetylmuramyl-(pentapeptide) pyrophosphoryl-undecaprenol N-acetylglucosamine transferase [candidate division KSB1 bacterium]NIT72825.1 UDP-N-acetylglucosamine--N-acetylmuramyl-(pentapeptide) pyrophosphoryl-undecaprenol N-acetylglucosamine transferase [candidate division KSB1 bacterium]NIW71000.1 UDP-N-acetylglucosamine--N-acetylmuramyl-(pentapeptide) pyrophosphoryl-undecaprenol N-acetylglucosamine transferase [candidate division KSB1 bacterium]NIX72505.1 UDP-N-acety
TALRMASGAADLAITRAGSTIFEIAAWGLPAIVVPITESNGNHQRKNAYTYARAGAAEVIEEQNLTPHLLASEVERLMGEEAERARMTKAAQEFARTDAADKIARQIIAVLSEHEK